MCSVQACCGALERREFRGGAGRGCPRELSHEHFIRKRRIALLRSVTHALQHAARWQKRLSEAQSSGQPGPRVPRLAARLAAGSSKVRFAMLYPEPLRRRPRSRDGSCHAGSLAGCGSSRYMDGRWSLMRCCIVVACHSSTSTTGSTLQAHRPE